MKAERSYPRAVVTAKAENAVLQGHPWIYDAEITALTGQPENGGLVDAVSRKGRYLGTGLYSKESKIRLRLISRNANDVFDDAFWERKLRWAWEYRKAVLREEDLTCCRVIRRGGRLPRADGGSVRPAAVGAGPLRGDGDAQAHDPAHAGGHPAPGRAADRRHL